MTYNKIEKVDFSINKAIYNEKDNENLKRNCKFKGVWRWSKMVNFWNSSHCCKIPIEYYVTYLLYILSSRTFINVANIFQKISIGILHSFNTKNQRMKDMLQAKHSAPSLKECKKWPISVCPQKNLHRTPNKKISTTITTITLSQLSGIQFYIILLYQNSKIYRTYWFLH